MACLLASATGHAYPWFIRHSYTGCMPCHADPSGAGALTGYGRAQGDLLLRTRYAASGEGEAGRSAGFLWGAIDPPETDSYAVLLGGDLRDLFMVTRVGDRPATHRFVPMRADLYGDVRIGRLRAAGSIGYTLRGALPAAVTRLGPGHLLSREHWIGVQLDTDGSMLIRAGRVNLPFGLRTIEHTLAVRQLTRTDLNDTQQHGLAFAYSRDGVRAEIMAIAGNFQVHPDRYRERGWSGYAELAMGGRAAMGLSTLGMRADSDVRLNVETTRMAQGAFARASPWHKLALLAEADALIQSPRGSPARVGYALLVQADVEPIQGLHFMLTGERWNTDARSQPYSYAAWGSITWFFAPHSDLRVDLVYQSIASAQAATDSLALLTQLHFFL